MIEYGYNFLEKLIKTGQAPGALDVCDNCIYQENNTCTFSGDPNMAQLPAGCPKKPETQKVFKLRDEMMKRGQDWIDLDPGDYEYEYGRADAYNEEIEEIIEECAGGVAELIKKDGAMEGTGGLPEAIKTIKEYIEEAANVYGWDYRSEEVVYDNLAKVIIRTLEELDYVDVASRKEIIDELAKEAQAFAPGPGPWEGNAKMPMTEEVSRSSPERSGAGPFVPSSQTHAHMDIPLSPGSTAEHVHTQSKGRTNSTADTRRGSGEKYKKAQFLSPDMSGQVNPNMNPGAPAANEGTSCPQCGANIPSGSTVCPQCGYSVGQPNAGAPAPTMASKLAYRLCYFCGQPIKGTDDFTIVWNQEVKDQLGVAHLPCAQTAAEQHQGEFDEQDDFIVVEELEKEKSSFEEEEMGEFETGDEVVVTEDFDIYDSGDLGRIVSDQEAQEAGMSPIRVDNKVYVKFDKDQRKIVPVPLDYIEKSSKTNGLRKQAIFAPCPKNYVPTVLLVLDHCYLASNDPDDIFACHDRTCKYHQPVSKAEWDRLQELEYSSPFSLVRRVW